MKNVDMTKHIPGESNTFLSHTVVFFSSFLKTLVFLDEQINELMKSITKVHEEL